MREFQRIVASYGTFVTIRKTMGADIASACGQLVVKKGEESKQDIVDIEDVGRENLTARSGPKVTTTRASNRQKQQSTGGDENASALEKYVRPLKIATLVAATSFAISSFLFLAQRRRR